MPPRDVRSRVPSSWAAMRRGRSTVQARACPWFKTRATSSQDWVGRITFSDREAHAESKMG